MVLTEADIQFIHAFKKDNRKIFTRSLLLTALIFSLVIFLLYITSNKLSEGLVINKTYIPTHQSKGLVQAQYTIQLQGVYKNKKQIEYNDVDLMTYNNIKIGDYIKLAK